jgi:hypothetical protein
MYLYNNYIKYLAMVRFNIYFNTEPANTSCYPALLEPGILYQKRRSLVTAFFLYFGASEITVETVAGLGSEPDSPDPDHSHLEPCRQMRALKK